MEDVGSEGIAEAWHLLLILLDLFLFLFFVLLFLLSSLNHSRCDSVQVPLTILANSTATVVSLLQDTDLLKRLADFSLDRSRGITVVRGTVSASVAASVKFC